MPRLIVSADAIFDGYQTHQNAQLVINDNVVECIESQLGSMREADCKVNGLIAPGFIDLQVNGGGGVLLNNTPTIDGVKTMLAAHQLFGTTAMLPTLITDTVAVMAQAADAIAGAIKDETPGILGVHFEGPNLSHEKKGAHSSQYIRKISTPEWDILSRQDLGQIAVTIAPENMDDSDITRLVGLGIKVFLGHSNASFDTAQAAIDAGASGFTHLFNAMSPMTGREPGMVGAAFKNDHAVCGLIVDGHHVDYQSCQIALKVKPVGTVILVTDAMSVVGTTIERFDFFDREIIRTGNKLNSTTGELAGSALDMATAIKNAHNHLNITLEEAIRMASLYPAKYLGLEATTGHLQTNALANFVVLNDDIVVTQTWVHGKMLS
jgi:N-acetylglucosamine-6-phosphate deacetylase